MPSFGSGAANKGFNPSAAKSPSYSTGGSRSVGARPGATARQPAVASATSPSKSGFGNTRTMGRPGSAGAHYSTNNANTAMTVSAVEPMDSEMAVLHLEGENGAKASLPMSAEEAAAYPEGSNVVLHCVPQEEEAEAEDNGIEEAGEGPAAIGPRRMPKAMKMGAILDKFRAEKEE